VSKIFADKQPTSAPTKTSKQEQADDQELASILDSAQLIERYNASQLTGRDRLKHQASKLTSLGLDTSKPPTMPARMRHGIQQAKETRDRKQMEQLGLPYKKVKKVNKQRSNKGLRMATGKFKNGMLTIASSDIKRINRSKS
jgi:hypothetical protein